ncbi:MAG: 4'-phosphopantetheinyl transferase superfamily protein [Gammaproteobacteria bacterium]|nr:4'-phosphopantetheinyl transferase superfamily protein [Gammaproteobacteria bacterium]
MRSQNCFKLPEDFPGLQPAEIHVWLLEIPPAISALNDLWKLLSKVEQKRALRFKFAKHKERFIVVHAYLRQLLANYLARSPEELTFTSNKYGKPALDDAAISFNISHSGDYALYAFAAGAELGIDIEGVKSGHETSEDLTPLAERFFSEAEVVALLAVPKAEQNSAFFNGWTRKEAFIKAIGTGLSFPLNKFDVDLRDSGDQLLTAVHDSAYKAEDWQLINLSAPANYKAALCYAGSGLDMRHLNFKI